MAIMLENLAYIDNQENRYGEALELEDQVLKIRRKILAPDDPVIAKSLYNVGAIREQQGDVAGAVMSLQEAVKILSIDSSRIPDVCEAAFAKLGSLLEKTADWQRAADAHLQALEIARKRKVPPTALADRLTKAGVLLFRKLENFDEAEPLLLEAYSLLEASDVDKRIRIDAARQLVSLYEAWDRSDQAEEWRERIQ